jgi:hypothetical protein
MGGQSITQRFWEPARQGAVGARGTRTGNNVASFTNKPSWGRQNTAVALPVTQAGGRRFTAVRRDGLPPVPELLGAMNDQHRRLATGLFVAAVP